MTLRCTNFGRRSATAGEATAHPCEVIEAALTHRLKDEAEAAYARGDLFAKRRNLIDNWAAFLTAG